jgi:hypothetical protein
MTVPENIRKIKNRISTKGAQSSEAAPKSPTVE